MKNNIMKFIVAVVLVSVVNTANAGFLTGVIVGSAMSSGPSRQEVNTLFASDVKNHDVVVCCTNNMVNNTMCQDVRTTRGIFDLTPAQFAKQAGYNILYKTGFIKTAHGCDMIVMEVGR